MNINTILNLIVFSGFITFLGLILTFIYSKLPWRNLFQQPVRLVMLGVSLAALAFGTTMPRATAPVPIQPQQVRQVLNGDHLKQLLLESSEKRSHSPLTNLTPGMVENTDAAEDGTNSFVDTNSQVEGVKEGDIIKTDGNMVYYASRFESRIRVMSVDFQNQVNYVATISLTTDTETVYTDSLYLTKDYLVVIGYRYDFSTSQCATEDENGDVYVCADFMWWQPTGSVVIIDRESLSIVYSLRTNAAFIDHRLIPLKNAQDEIVSETLYLVGHHYLYGYDEDANIRPYFIEQDGVKTYLPYQAMYFVEGDDLFGMTTITGIVLDDNAADLTYQSQGYLGASPDFKKMYVNQQHLYLAQANYRYDEVQSFQTTTIYKFVLQVSEGTTMLKTVGTIRGVTVSQFALDEYQGYFRIATTETVWDFRGDDWWWSWESRQVKNRLYVLEDANDGQFAMVAVIDEGLGKPGESITSARFAGPMAYIVTFLNRDPLYIIDLSDPLNPVIRQELVLPGFDTYQHPWGDDHLLGLGYNADDNGLLTGMKLTAYNVSDNESAVIQTLDFSQWQVQDATTDGQVWTWSWAEALWDHKAITVSVDHGIFAFAVNAMSYQIVQEGDTREDDDQSDGSDETEPGWVRYEYTFHSYYLIFRIDMDAATPIAQPIRIDHPTSDLGYVQVDRGVIINDVIHTFSNQQMISYDLTNDQILQTLTFPEYR